MLAIFRPTKRTQLVASGRRNDHDSSKRLRVAEKHGRGFPQDKRPNARGPITGDRVQEEMSKGNEHRSSAMRHAMLHWFPVPDQEKARRRLTGN